MEGHWFPPEPRFYAAAVIFGGNLIGPFGCVGLDGDGCQMGRLVKVDALYALVEIGDLDIGRRQARQCGDGERLHLPGAHVFLADFSADMWSNECDLHESLLSAIGETVKLIVTHSDCCGCDCQGSTSQGTG